MKKGQFLCITYNFTNINVEIILKIPSVRIILYVTFSNSVTSSRVLSSIIPMGVPPSIEQGSEREAGTRSSRVTKIIDLKTFIEYIEQGTEREAGPQGPGAAGSPRLLI